MFSIFLMNRCERRKEKEVCPWQMEGSFRHEVSMKYSCHYPASSILKLIINHLDYLFLIGYHPAILKNDPMTMYPIRYDVSTPTDPPGGGQKEA